MGKTSSAEKNSSSSLKGKPEEEKKAKFKSLVTGILPNVSPFRKGSSKDGNYEEVEEVTKKGEPIYTTYGTFILGYK